MPPVKSSGGWWKVSLALALVAAGGIGAWQWNRLSAGATGRQPTLAESSAGENLQAEALRQLPVGQTTNSSLDAEDLAAVQAVGAVPPEELLNHRRYEEVSPEALVSLSPNSAIKLQPAAQASVKAMIAQAKAEGVQLGVISGFRSLEDQTYLFFEVKAERGETSRTRAEVSAPPGYSEHHTGYAVDFIDESQPETHIEESFETTAAYRWLEKNAASYSFEMSFPKDPSSPLSYEPWHWRYVGDQKSLELFYRE